MADFSNNWEFMGRNNDSQDHCLDPLSALFRRAQFFFAFLDKISWVNRLKYGRYFSYILNLHFRDWATPLIFLFAPLKNILEQKNDMIPTKGLDGITGLNESSGMTHPYVRVLETIFQNSSDQIHCGNCNEKFELKNFLSFWQVNFR